MQKSEKILVGKEEICSYAGFSCGVFQEMLNIGFPAVKFAGAWRAHVQNIDDWTQVVTRPTGPQQDKED